MTVVKPSQETSEKRQDEQETIKKKKDDEIKVLDRTNTIDKRRDKSFSETTNQFHRDRAPGNQNTGRNLRLQPRKNYLVLTSLKKLMPLNHVQRRANIQSEPSTNHSTDRHLY